MDAEISSRSLVENVLLAGCLAVTLTSPAHAIVGASSEAQNLAPHVLMVLERHGTVAGFCTGIVVAPDVVLTAAHCAPAGADLRIHFKDPDGTPVLLPVAQAVHHPGYRADAIRTRRRSIDLALLRLPAPLPGRFRPVALGSMASTTAGAMFTVAGFGVAREDDGATSGVLRATALAARAPLSSLLLWAKDPADKGAGACTGDSGGPVMTPASETVEALILWSAGTGKSGCGALTQALWLQPQRQWIDSLLARWRAGP